jgi:DNA-binding transcriptional MerR regulator
MYTIKELSSLKGVPEVTIRYWILKKRLKASQNVDRFNPRRWYVSESEWLEIPVYIRNRYQP